MRRTLAGIGALVALSASLVSVAPGSAQNDPASRAVRYLLTLQHPSGAIDFEKLHAQSETSFAVMGAAATGLDPTQLRRPGGGSPLDYLAAHSAAAAGTPDGAAGPTAEVILAAVAARQNPRHFGPQNVNLVQRLEGPDNKREGAYGFGDTRAQALGVLAVVAAAAPVDARAVARLQGMQDADGSWNQGSLPAATGDTDSTAMAVMALVAATGDVPRRALVLGYLQGQQNPSDGGFPFQRPPPGYQANNPHSDGLAIQALVALHENPTGPAWTKGGKTALDDLLSFQVPASGGFHPVGKPTPPPDGGTTAPLIAAAALRPLPVKVAYPATQGLSVQSAAVVRALQFQAKNLEPTDAFSAGAVEDTLIGMASAGFDPQTLKLKNGVAAYAYLATNIPSPASPGGTGHLIEAVVAGGLDPRAFPADHPHNLVAELETTANPSGSFGDGGVYGNAIAVLGEVAAGVTVSPQTLTYLKLRQHSDGSFTYTAALNPAATDGDTNSTSMVVQALDAAGDHGVDGAALTYLRREQSSLDGGFVYSGTPRTAAGPATMPTSDPDSTALVVEALVAAHQNPLTYVQGCFTPISYLLAAQDVSGGYEGVSWTFETSQIPQGLERLASPVRAERLVTRGLALPATVEPGPATASLSGCDYTPPQDPAQPSSDSTTGPLSGTPRTGGSRRPTATARRGVLPAQVLARSNGLGAATALSVLGGTAAPPTPATTPPPPVAAVVPTANPTAGPIVGGVKGISDGGAASRRASIRGGPGWLVYPVAAAVALALVVLVGLMLRARRSVAAG